MFLRMRLLSLQQRRPRHRVAVRSRRGWESDPAPWLQSSCSEAPCSAARRRSFRGRGPSLSCSVGDSSLSPDFLLAAGVPFPLRHELLFEKPGCWLWGGGLSWGQGGHCSDR